MIDNVCSGAGKYGDSKNIFPVLIIIDMGGILITSFWYVKSVQVDI